MIDAVLKTGSLVLSRIPDTSPRSAAGHLMSRLIRMEVRIKV